MTKKISAVIIDTYENKTLAKLAIDKTLECNQIGRVYTLSDEPFYPGAEFFQIPKIRSINEYEKWVLGDLIEVVSEDFLVIQWDGFVLDPKNWRDEYLNYDFIGAPHNFGQGDVVGNGGFSFRSLKLMEQLKILLNDANKAHENYIPEDILISMSQHPLEEAGIKFAPISLASQFAFQDGECRDLDSLFGFHSPWNFPLFFAEKQLLLIYELIIQRINNFHILTLYLDTCQKKNMRDLFLNSVNVIDKYPDLVKIIDRGLADESDRIYAPLFIKLMGG